MTDIVLGVLAVVAGALLCFRGQLVLRLVLPVWGAFAGFSFGAGLVAGLAEEHFLGSVLGWVLGIVFAALFAVFAYVYYAVAVVIVMASVGFAIGSGVVVALGIDWNWVAVLSGVVAGLLVGLGAAVVDAPMLVLVVFSAIGGAVALVAGFMLFSGALDSSSFTQRTVASQVHDDWWWYVAFVVLALAGVLSQLRGVGATRRGIRSTWAATTI